MKAIVCSMKTNILTDLVAVSRLTDAHKLVKSGETSWHLLDQRVAVGPAKKAPVFSQIRPRRSRGGGIVLVWYHKSRTMPRQAVEQVLGEPLLQVRPAWWQQTLLICANCDDMVATSHVPAGLTAAGGGGGGRRLAGGGGGATGAATGISQVLVSADHLLSWPHRTSANESTRRLPSSWLMSCNGAVHRIIAMLATGYGKHIRPLQSGVGPALYEIVMPCCMRGRAAQPVEAC